MATVEEILKRLESEKNGSGRGTWDPLPPKKSLAPNRKVWTSLVAGLVASLSAYMTERYGFELNADGTAFVTALLMSVVAYVVKE